MRKPHLRRDVALAFAASGLAACVAAFRLPEAMAGEIVRAVLFTYGSSALLFGGGTALHWHLLARARDALARGDEVMARWRIEPALWRDFLALNDRLQQEPQALPGELPLDRPVPAHGFELIAGQAAVQIGEDVIALPRRGEPQVTRATMVRSVTGVTYVELQLYVAPNLVGDNAYPARWSVLRFPVQRGAEREAMRFVAFYEAGRPGTADFFHGRGDGSDAADESSCSHCGFKTHKYLSVCPQCGGSLLSKRWAGRFGIVIGIGGLLITGTMLAVLYSMAPLLLHPGRSIGGTRFAGTAPQAAVVFAILAVVLALGLFFTLYGFWQSWRGVRPFSPRG